ncbi:MAG: RHS repeat-associated core domain-containing protein [Bacteroides sp.]|nr:RHS repeat-associated core domain-containing protein [Bacteroides sp.]MCM1413803.1 RHS repeat-associated core domain-containing protein [Bacteroides sp.]
MRSGYSILPNICLWVMLMIHSTSMSAQDGAGRYPEAAISLPSDSVYFKSVHTDNATDWGYSAYDGDSQGQNIYYNVALPRKMSLVVHTIGSELLCTRVQIFGPGYSSVVRARDKEDYFDYFRHSQHWTGINSEISQDCFVAFDLPAGVYEIRVSGYRYYHNNAVNGPITTTVIGFGPDAPDYPDIPPDYIPGTEGHPFPLGKFHNDFLCEVNDRFGPHFTLGRPNGVPVAFYEFSLERPLDLTFINASPISVDSDSTYIGKLKSDSTTCGRCKSGRYLITVPMDTDSLNVWFRFFGTVPPLPREPYEYGDISLYDSRAVGTNYVSRRTMITAGGDYVEQISHVDGLGRPVETLQVDASPGGGSIVTWQTYDGCGRESLSYLPGVAQTGSAAKYANPTDIDCSTVYGGDTRPFTQTIYEQSPLARPRRQFGAGERWFNADVAINTDYDVNSANGERSCICFSITDTPDMSSDAVTVSCDVSSSGSIYYEPGELIVRKITDEDGNTTLTFMDIYDRTVLSRRIIDGGYADTYDIYDSYGNLTVVLTPELSARISGPLSMTSGRSELLDKYAYIYTYDRWGQMLSKKTPGCESVKYQYDNTGRCVMWQDGNLRARNLWHFDVADVFGRPCVSGTCESGRSMPTHVEPPAIPFSWRAVRSDQSAVSGTALAGYVIANTELRNAQVLTVTYYDDYSFMGQNGVADATVLGYEAREGFGQRCGNVHGQVTGTVTALPVEAGADSLTMVCSAVYYDSRDRVVQSVATNHLGGTDRISTEYDFTGHPLTVRSEHRTAAMGADSSIVCTERRIYDRFGRELTLTHRFGEGAGSKEVTVRTNTYDAVGRLLTESLGKATERTYEYDVRSHPVGITAYNYRQRLDFTYGGNVSRMTWWAFGPYESERSYAYSYDPLSRLIEARYSDADGGSGHFDVSYTYDLNGNVTSLQRMGLYDNGRRKQYGLIDDLTLEYDGNMLRRVTDGCSGPFYQGAYHFVDGADEVQEYAYDANGNTVMDLNRRVVAASYDFNNRPRLIAFESGSSTAYLYDAAGMKRRTLHRVASERPAVPGAEPADPELFVSRTDYCGNIIYEDSLLSRINFDGGYLSLTGSDGDRLDTPAYHFYHRDHLGNNRMDLGENGAVWQISHYYPYGMLMGCSYLAESQRWKFGGKELDRVSGLDLSDFKARLYDPALGRFLRPDDLADKYHPLSPYLYCAANPLIVTDPLGMLLEFGTGTSTEFKEKYQEAVQYLALYGADDIIQWITSSEGFTITLMDNTGNMKSFYNPTQHAIYWDPNMAISTTECLISPAEILSHEADHAKRNILDPTGSQIDRDTDDSQYGNREDRRVIEGSETENARKLGKIAHDQQTRYDHGGIRWTVDNVDQSEIDGVECVAPHIMSKHQK